MSIEAVLTSTYKLCLKQKLGKKTKKHNFSSENYRFYNREKCFRNAVGHFLFAPLLDLGITLVADAFLAITQFVMHF